MPFDFEEDHFGRCESDDPPDDDLVLWKYCDTCEEDYELPEEIDRCLICRSPLHEVEW